MNGRYLASHDYCAAKEESDALWAAFGWRLHLLCSDTGIPIGFEWLPSSLHDVTLIRDLAQCVPTGATVYGDKAYTSGKIKAWREGDAAVRLVAVHKQNMKPNVLGDGVACDGSGRSSRA